MLLKDYMDALPRETLVQIIRDKLMMDASGGRIGDCVLRRAVDDYIALRGFDDVSTIMWMELVSNYAAVTIAVQHLEETGEL